MNFSGSGIHHSSSCGCDEHFTDALTILMIKMFKTGKFATTYSSTHLISFSGGFATWLLLSLSLNTLN
jgi:hypothetical protein